MPGYFPPPGTGTGTTPTPNPKAVKDVDGDLNIAINDFNDIGVLENTASTGSTVTIAGGTHEYTRLYVENGTFNPTTPFVYGDNIDGTIYVQIYKSNLTECPFATILPDVNVVGFVTLASGRTIYYGNTPSSQEHFILINSDTTGSFLNSYVKVDVSSGDITYTLPDPTTGLASKFVDRIIITNLGNVTASTTSGNPEDAVTSNVVNISIPADSEGNTRTFTNGLAQVSVPYGKQLTFSLLSSEQTHIWHVVEALTYDATIYDNVSQINGSASTNFGITISSTNDNGNLWEVDADNSTRLNIKANCIIKFDFMRATFRWTGSTSSSGIFNGTVQVRKNGGSTDQLNFVTNSGSRLSSFTLYGFTSNSITMPITKGDYIEFRAVIPGNTSFDFFRTGITTTI